jgi:hypothetical protein
MKAWFLVPGRDDVHVDIVLVPRVGDQVVLFEDPQAYEVESVTWRVPGERVMIKLRDWRASPQARSTAASELLAAEHEQPPA